MYNNYITTTDEQQSINNEQASTTQYYSSPMIIPATQFPPHSPSQNINNDSPSSSTYVSRNVNEQVSSNASSSPIPIPISRNNANNDHNIRYFPPSNVSEQVSYPAPQYNDYNPSINSINSINSVNSANSVNQINQTDVIPVIPPHYPTQHRVCSYVDTQQVYCSPHNNNMCVNSSRTPIQMNHPESFNLKTPGLDIYAIPNSSTLTNSSVRTQYIMHIPGYDIVAIPNSSTFTNHSVGVQNVVHPCRTNNGNHTVIHCPQQQCLHHPYSYPCSSYHNHC